MAAGALVLALRTFGQRASLPATFDRCNNFDAAGQRCAFMATGPWFPADSHCRQQCPGLKAVLPARQEHQKNPQQAGDTPLNARPFLDATSDVESSPLTARIGWRQLARAMEHLS